MVQIKQVVIFKKIIETPSLTASMQTTNSAMDIMDEVRHY